MLSLAGYFQNILSTSPEFVVFFISALPISELRGSIPLAIGYYGIKPMSALIIAIIGNMIPVFLLLWFLEHIAQWMMKRSEWWNFILNAIFKRTHLRTHDKFAKYGISALILLVAIPLPFTGAWTGSIAAWLFGIPYWKAIGLIFIGVIIAGLIVMGVSIGFFNFI